MHHRQAKARALADPLGRIKRFDRAAQRLLVHAGARIDHRQCYEAGIDRGLVGRCDSGAGRDRNRSAVGHGVAGVDAEIEDRHFQLVGIGQRGRKALGQIEPNPDMRPRRAVHQIRHAPHEFAEIDCAGLQRLPPRKGEQALHQRLGAFGRLQSPLDQPRFAIG
ncbi:hypothetical protein D9M73_147120 [compost metagenome]